MDSLFIGWSTFQNEADAIDFAEKLIKSGLAACAQVDGPVKSFYEWKGALESTQEWRIAVKFLESKSAEIDHFFSENHPYDTPQWLAAKAEIAGDAYLNWVREK